MIARALPLDSGVTMQRILLVFAMAAVLLGWFGAACAQYQYSPYYGTQASTAAQAAAMGMSDLVRSAGSYNLQTSEAAINYTQAESQRLSNQLQGAQNYYQMRNMYESYEKQQATPGLTSEESWRLAQENLPKRLRPNQLDPVTGQIYWPMLLQDPRYDKYRQSLDKLFRERETTHGGGGYDLYVETQQATDALMAELRKNLQQYSGTDYMQMKNFIESLAYESKFPAV